MKSFIYFFFSSLLLLALLPAKGFTQNITLTTSPIAASNIAQGTSFNSVYVVKMDVTVLPVTVNSLQFTLSGTHDADDLSTITIWFNAAAPTVAGATALVNLSGLFAAPHIYNSGTISRTIAAGASGYFIITATTAAAATNGNTVKLDGAANPVVFGFTTSPTITNNQTDIAGTQTIQAAEAMLTTSPIAAANIAQGTTFNPLYIVKMDVTSLPVTINNLQFTLTGTHDNNDLTTVTLWFNASAPTVSGATGLVNLSGLFAAPHTYNSGLLNTTIAAGASGYFIITVTTAAAATTGNTVKLDGAVNPVIFGFTTAPTITNNQTDAAGTQIILAAGVTLTTISLATSTILQGTSFSPVYIIKMDVTSLPLLVNSLQFTLTGTHDADDITTATVWYNTTAPTVAGATGLVNTSGLFAAPHTYTVAVSQNIAAGASGYFIITVTTAAAATAGNTIKLNGAANPAIFGFTTSPPVTNNQTDGAGIQTITGALPLTLLSFTGNTINTQSVQLQWITTGEFNTKDFAVEWSVDGLHFNKIAILPAGNKLQDLHYSYMHKQPVDGNNYYRLKMVDIDGRFNYSPVIKIKIAVTATKIAVFPNPVINILNLQVQSDKEEAIVINLYNADGKAIASKTFIVTKGNNLLSWNLQQLTAGNYFISSDTNIFKPLKIIKL